MLFDASGRLYLSDFGCSCACSTTSGSDLSSGMRSSLPADGTMRYFAPERLVASSGTVMGTAAAACDVWAVGALVFESVIFAIAMQAMGDSPPPIVVPPVLSMLADPDTARVHAKPPQALNASDSDGDVQRSAAIALADESIWRLRGAAESVLAAGAFTSAEAILLQNAFAASHAVGLGDAAVSPLRAVIEFAATCLTVASDTRPTAATLVAHPVGRSAENLFDPIVPFLLLVS
jgi:serine/threonine protein kinase